MPRSLRSTPLASGARSAGGLPHGAWYSRPGADAALQQGELPRWHERTDIKRLRAEMLATFERVLARFQLARALLYADLCHRRPVGTNGAGVLVYVTVCRRMAPVAC